MGELELFENQNLKKVIYKMKFKKKKIFSELMDEEMEESHEAKR